MQGKKHSPEIKEKAIEMLYSTGNAEEVARAMNLPITTVNTWKYIIDESMKKENIVIAEKMKELRIQKKQEFIENAWIAIEKYLEKILSADVIDKATPRDAATILAILYDKAALAAGESTQNIDVAVQFEAKLQKIIDD